VKSNDHGDKVERQLGLKKVREVVKGNVIVTKNPCSHPGDIRLLRATDDQNKIDKLDHNVNTIVFPSKGYRPEQHKMSGGDLDGDVYLVIWEDLLVNELKPEMI
jgi:RNA-dependent RNA polymerase